MEDKKTQLTNEAGIPVGDNQNSRTAGPRGPELLENVWLLEKLAHFNRERIPERIVHAKGIFCPGSPEISGFYPYPKTGP